jgi:hypothetical protein
MARVRQARRCRANRTNGEPCKAYAIVGGTVCMAHGGSAPQVRSAAYVAQVEAAIRREFEAEWARWQREYAAWQAGRVLTTAELLGIPWQQVTSMDIVWCHVEYGRPALSDAAPKIRRDRRFRLPQPPARKRASVQETRESTTVRGDAA